MLGDNLSTFVVMLGLIACAQASSTVLPFNSVLDNMLSLSNKVGTKLMPVMSHPLSSDMVARLRSPLHRTTIFLPMKDVMDKYNIDSSQAEDAVELFKHHIVTKCV